MRPVGGEEEIAIDVRILCATHKPLADMVMRGEFRQDLYYRINVIQAQVPPLRERSQDIPALCHSIFLGLAERNGTDIQYTLSEEALDTLGQYTFPGNVRELENILERAVTLSDHAEIETSDLMLDMSNNNAEAPLITQHSEAAPSSDAPFEANIENHEKALIENALQKARYNKTKAAVLLGISFRQLRYRIKKLNLDK